MKSAASTEDDGVLYSKEEDSLYPRVNRFVPYLYISRQTGEQYKKQNIQYKYT